ncbi:unnamed protein product [Chrysodeixis includens]|uniref:Kazal-like domain-containing protein n=1 Tax=Chrysodeixis includens TaxID=689277 RepID=A0A9N8KVU4_CHRIL|nr:unnamed protein product [Chrysodeixis includens]
MDEMMYPNGETMTLQKRDTGRSSTEQFNSFIEEKLMQQSQALEHLVKKVDASGDLIKKLIDNLSRGIEKPRLPAKAEPEEVGAINKDLKVTQRSENPLLRLGKNIPKYGKLAKDLILKDMQSGTDPTPLLEKEVDPPTFLELGSRRSNGGDNLLSPSRRSESKDINPWCPLALLCQPNVDPICGFDDEFGYGKFEDLCHMLRVNCYWKYIFIYLVFVVSQLEASKACYKAKICMHDAAEKCGVNDAGKPRRFLDTCDILEYNCYYNDTYGKTDPSKCEKLPPIEADNEETKAHKGNRKGAKKDAKN